VVERHLPMVNVVGSSPFTRLPINNYVLLSLPFFDNFFKELDWVKLPKLLELKYHGINDAISELGDVEQIREIFTDFQQWLYLDENQAS